MWMPRLSPTNSNSRRRLCAACICRTFADGPTGMSSRMCVAPAASFFDRIDATICPCESNPSGRSTEISVSSAGARRAVPPQAMQPRCLRTMSCSAFIGSSTRASTSIVSAVPAGEVIARLDVFGISMPCAATIGTTIIDVRLPGTPPMQCLSATSGSRQSSRSPDSSIARVRCSTSSRSSSLSLVATRNAAISVFDRWFSVTSWMMPR